MSKFIVIEGLDGAGTTTQSQRLHSALVDRGEQALLTREPSDGPIGTMIRQMLAMRIVAPQGTGYAAVNRESLALLFAADRLDHIDVEIAPALDAGTFVVSDRYYHSSFAYQGDVDGSDHFDIQWVRTLNERALKPDMTFFLQAPTELCMERLVGRGHRDIYESQEKLARLEKRYAQIMATLKEEGEPIMILDAAEPIADLHAKILEAVVTL